MVTDPVIARTAEMMQLNQRKVVAATYGSMQAKSATMSGMGFC
jgi:hypothetical protein